jgi:8-oxo-dGTP diphosphatase
MHCYLCSVASGEIELREHKSAQWLTAETLDSVEWLPADEKIIVMLQAKNLTT